MPPDPFHEEEVERAAALAWARFLLNRATVRVRDLEDAAGDTSTSSAPDSRRMLGVLDSR